MQGTMKTIAAVLLEVIAVAGMAGCTPREAATAGRIGPTTTDDRPECPHDPTMALHRLSTTMVSEAIADVPEFHDCQRFLGAPDDTAGYGPLVGLYVSQALPLVEWPGTKFDTVMRSPAGLPVGVPEGWGVPVAMVIGWDGQPYERLGITGMYQCLYLRTPTQAVMVPVAEGAMSLCREALPPDEATGTSLVVRHLAADQPPPVGRWDHDGTGQFISIACPGGWCEIGPEGFGESASYAAPEGSTPEQAARYSVKPWYDEQRLAVPATPGAGGLSVVPGGAVGTAIPVGNLALLDLEGGMVQVGWLAINASSENYRAKLGFDNRAVGSTMASVHLCNGDTATCAVPDNIASALACDGWWAKIRSPRQGPFGGLLDLALGVPTQYHCVVYRDHGSMGGRIPATMRWRWRKDDEGVWTKCKSGCCELT